MSKQPSSHVPTKAHNRKEDKTSWAAFFKNQVPTGKFSLPKDTHLLKDHSAYMAQNFGILFPIVSKKTIDTFKGKLKTYLYTNAYNSKKKKKKKKNPCKVPFIMPGIQ